MWKRIILAMALTALIAAPALAISPFGRGPNYDSQFWTYPHGAGINWATDMQNAVQSGENVGTGKVFYVDSGITTEGNGESWGEAKDTLEEAIQLCTASRGDVIMVAEGHAESYGDSEGFDLDMIGVRVIGCGVGALRPTFTFTHADAQCSIGAASCALVNMRFLAGVTGVKVGIEVEAAADDCMIVNCDFPEPAAGASEFLTAIEIETTVDRLTVAGCTAYSADAAGAATWILMTAGINNGIQILDNTVFGDYSTAIVSSDDADLEILILGGQYTNINADEFCFEFSGNATGWIDDVTCSTDVYTTCIDPGLMAVGFGATWFDYDAGTNQTGAPMFTLAATGVWTFDLGTNGLDHLVLTAVADVTDHVDMQEIGDDTILANMLTIDGDIVDYDRRYDSLEALGDDTDLIIADFTDYSLDELASATTGVVADADPSAKIVDFSVFAHLMGNDATTDDYDCSTDSLEAISVALAAGTGATTAIEADNLDHLTATTGVAGDADLTTYVADKSVLSHIMSDGADTSEYLASTDSLEALGTGAAAILADTSSTSGIDYYRPHMISMTATADDDDLFAVAGGPIEIQSLYGIVTTTIDSNAASIEIILDATAPYTDHDFTTAVAWTSDAAGTRYVFDDTEGEAVLTPCEGADAGSGGTMTGWFCGIGMIEQSVDVQNLDGVVVWYMKWVPLTTGVTVTAQ